MRNTKTNLYKGFNQLNKGNNDNNNDKSSNFSFAKTHKRVITLNLDIFLDFNATFFF